MVQKVSSIGGGGLVERLSHKLPYQKKENYIDKFIFKGHSKV